MPGAGEGILSGGPLSENYQILQLHFHWGKDNTKGSEHTYDGAAFPLEMHVVHVKSSLYTNLESALSTTDGLAVTGFQFSIGVCNIITIRKVPLSFLAVMRLTLSYDKHYLFSV